MNSTRDAFHLLGRYSLASKREFNKRNPIINPTRDRYDWEKNKYGWNALHFLCGFNSSEKKIAIKSLIQIGTDEKSNDIESRILSRFTSNKKSHL